MWVGGGLLIHRTQRWSACNFKSMGTVWCQLDRSTRRPEGESWEKKVVQPQESHETWTYIDTSGSDPTRGSAGLRQQCLP